MSTGTDPTAPWRQLYRATVESGRRASGLAALMARLAPRCAELVRELPRQMVDGGPATDPLEITLRLYDATSGPLSAMIQDVLTDEAFLQLSRGLLENVATAESLLSRLTEDFFHRLGLATSSDATRVATLVIGLDEKIDRLEDAVDDLEHGDGALARGAELARLREQISRLEAKWDRALAGDPAAGHAGNGAGDPTEAHR